MYEIHVYCFKEHHMDSCNLAPSWENITMSQKPPVCPSLETHTFLNFSIPLPAFSNGHHCLFVCPQTLYCLVWIVFKLHISENIIYIFFCDMFLLNLTYYFWDPFILVYSYSRFIFMVWHLIVKNNTILLT